MPAATTWEKTKTGSKKGFDTVYSWVDKLGAPVNKLSNKLGSEAFWPTTLDKESDKAARILKSFCKDGFYDEELRGTPDGPTAKQKVLKKIPREVIANAKGLAIFTTMRTGLWVSGAGGSGILVARKADGSWSPPSGIMLHTAGLGFLVGVDIYDCVVVINHQKALDAFTKIRCTLGGEVSAVAGPVGVGGIMETEIHKRQAPIWTYLKSRGFYAGVQIDGTVIIERTDENERFYGERIAVKDILAGKVRHPPYETKMLMETIKSAQGDSDVDESALPGDGPAPGDMELERRKSIFGVPDMEDPDPFGVHALEKEGLDVLEAGTRTRPSSQQFEYRPSPTSPIFNTFSRRSFDDHRASRHGSWRSSMMSVDRGTQTANLAGKDDDHQVRLPVPSNQEGNGFLPNHYGESLPVYAEPEDVHEGSDEQLHETTEGPTIISKARLVTIRKRTPPTLPPRNSLRGIEPLTVNVNPLAQDRPVSRDIGTGGSSPGWDGFNEVPLNGTDHKSGETGSNATEDPYAAAGIAKEEEGKSHSTIAVSPTPDGELPQHSTVAMVNGKSEAEEDRFHSLPTTPVESWNRGEVMEPSRVL
ncbi:MAG: hypothetical protein M1812_003418 [Candelaria pacifica]|nr:MAG: hypothetical protein M1812_003418 [Candelaria pacifica]